MLFVQDFFQFFYNLMQLLLRIETSIFFIDKIYCCFFPFYPIRRVYIWSTFFKIYYMTYLHCNKLTQSKIKSLTFIDVSNPNWYLERCDWKRSSTISSIILSFIINQFYVIISWMHYKLFIIDFRRHKVNCYC